MAKNTTLSRFLRYLNPYIGTTLLAMGFALVGTICDLGRIQILEDTVDTLKKLEEYRQSTETIPIAFFHIKGFFDGFELTLSNAESAIRFFLWLLGAVIGLVFVKGLFGYWSDFLMERVGNKLSLRVRNDLYQKIISAPLGILSKQHSGDIMTRVTDDVRMLQQGVAATASIMRAAIHVIVFITAMFYKNIELTIYSMLILPLVAYFISRIGIRVRKASTEIQQRSSDIYTQLKETLSGINIIKSFTAEKAEMARFQTTTSSQYDSAIRRARFASLLPPVIDWMGTIGTATVFALACWQVIDGKLSIGEFVGYFFMVALMFKPIKIIGTVNNVLQQSLASAERIFHIADLTEEAYSVKGKNELLDVQGAVEFQNVSFAYNESNVINNISFKVDPGDVVALVGHSGSGKTTLVNLLQGFYAADAGSILIDNYPINEVTLTSLRRNIALVPQDTFLFDGTVLENIKYGYIESSREAVIDAAIKANAHEFINQMSNGYDTPIGEEGGNLSGGEQQRLSIARAILKNAPILVLDEATSSLDSQSEAIIQESLKNLMVGRTSFIIAHRLSTVMSADKIMVISEGKIVESGTHDTLLEKAGIYSNLCKQQIFA